MPVSEALSSATKSSKVVVVGLNAALQKRFVLSPSAKLVPGSVHRADHMEEGVGGKGQDVAISLSCLVSDKRKMDDDEEMDIALAQFIGAGAEGEQVLSLLRTNFCLDDALTVRPEAKLRTCTTIVGSDCSTELVEPSGSIQQDELDSLMAKVHAKCGGGDNDASVVDALCIMGSMPPGCPSETYADIYSRAAADNTLVLIDSVVGVQPLLQSLSTGKKKGAVLKINASELCRLANVEQEESTSEADKTSEKDIRKAVTSFFQTFKVGKGALDYMAITDGRHPAHLVEILKDDNEDASSPSFQMLKMDVIDLLSTNDNEPITLYPIGAGDTVAAGTLAAWQCLSSFQGEQDQKQSRNLLSRKVQDLLATKRKAWGLTANIENDDMALAFAFGLACGSASCLQEENSVFDVEDAMGLLGKMGKPQSLS
uniref:Carbohydrate kinase PfkB domain-containing protein n=1 Tax=Ditylum brightwellii TaxID=49249 RepID=A0A6U3Q5E1_9STRA